MSIVSLDHNFVLIRVPKTGSTSQAKLYSEYGMRVVTDTFVGKAIHVTSGEIKNVFREKKWDWGGFFKFGFVRNPWEREVSYYFFFRKRKQIKDNMSFSEYLENQSGMPSGGWEMNTYLTDVDYVARYENFEEETNSIWKKLNLPGRPKLKKYNATEHKPYWEYYSDKEILLVQETYKKDIELYNYEFGDI